MIAQFCVHDLYDHNLMFPLSPSADTWRLRIKTGTFNSLKRYWGWTYNLGGPWWLQGHMQPHSPHTAKNKCHWHLFPVSEWLWMMWNIIRSSYYVLMLMFRCVFFIKYDNFTKISQIDGCATYCHKVYFSHSELKVT